MYETYSELTQESHFTSKSAWKAHIKYMLFVLDKLKKME